MSHVHKIMDASVYTEACDIMALPLSLYVQVFPFCPDITAMMDFSACIFKTFWVHPSSFSHPTPTLEDVVLLVHTQPMTL